MRYELYYRPTIQGRDEFVRLALEDAGADYLDVARLPEASGGGEATLSRFLDDDESGHPPFAPPFLKAGRRVIAQTANILLYLGPRAGLAPADETGRLWTHQLQLTVADLIAEIHEAHHPISSGLYYEDQQPEAKQRSGDLRRRRLPKYLGYFERVLAANARGQPLSGRQRDNLRRSFIVPDHRRIALRVSAQYAPARGILAADDRSARSHRRASRDSGVHGLAAAHPVQQRRTVPPLSGT